MVEVPHEDQGPQTWGSLSKLNKVPRVPSVHIKDNSPPPLICSFWRVRAPSTAALQPCELSHHVPVNSVRWQPLVCMQISSSPYLFPIVCALAYRHFRETPSHVNFLESIWAFSITLSCRHFLIYVHTFEVIPLQSWANDVCSNLLYFKRKGQCLSL